MKRKIILASSFATVFIAGILWVVCSWNHWFYSITTDNAYVQSNVTAIAPKISGYVTKVEVNDNAVVKKGDLLFSLDQRDYLAKVEQAKANVLAAEATINNVKASIKLQDAVIAQAKAQLTSVEANQQRALQEYNRFNQLYREKVASKQKLEEVIRDKKQADASLLGARANVDVKIQQLDVLATQLDSAKAQLAQKKAMLSLANLDLEHCNVYAPISGIVGNRKVRVGRYVTTGASLLDIVPLDDVWIVANFKETQLGGIQIGQKVNIHVDGYSDTDLVGSVDSLSPGSGSAFSLLPPDNATGNFIRVVQRVPVKITLDENNLQGRLVPGLSVRVSVLSHTNN
ncbi:HlyD family secretion protein [Orbaceae bacterium ac157xtp]